MLDITALPTTPFTTADAASWGIGPEQLAAAVAESELHHPLRGIYLRGDIELTVLARAQAARPVTSPFSVICDRTAAWIHEIDVLLYAELDIPPPLEVCVLRGHRAINRPQCLGLTRDLRDEDVMQIGGVWVTTPLRTAIDLACKLSRRRALAGLDAFMRHHGVTHTEMKRLLVRYFRRRGVVQARQLVPLADPRAESAGESWARIEILDHGFAVPELQWWVYVGGVATYRLDLAWPRARVAVEYDGAEHHTDPEDTAYDETRRNLLRSMGWTIIVLDKDSFSPEAVDGWVRELADALSARLAA
ncbi:DUF559 domain-containing protein [Nocardioides sp.]|uniref:DUF559 domain-containing protein n=1 Tax=Nocardioides sp. TaxID=35761 RepID=UPI0027346985|nr:DUF559 domain-containing protein [Nocardioides sp.]MDP3892445.1 DUF559 domain-containing protein [Nocardioides sp.]